MMLRKPSVWQYQWVEIPITIGCMTSSIAATRPPFTICSSYLSSDIENKCRELLTPDLLDINDRFLEFINRPLKHSLKIDV